MSLTDNFVNFMRDSFPSLTKAEEAIFEVTGITLEQMRSKRRYLHFSHARAVFWSLCAKEVSPHIYLASYLNRDHSTGYKYEYDYMNEHQYDNVFQSMYVKVKEVFDSKK